MSMEQAILELAGGMKELAVAVREAAMMNAECTKLNGEMMLAQARQIVFADSAPTADTELEEAITKVEQKAKGTTQKEAAEKQDALEKERALAKAEAERNAAEAAKDDDNLIGADDKVLDYKADVTPVLIELHKKKAGLKDLLAKFGVTKGDQLKPEQFADIVAQAKVLLAA